MTNIAAYTAEGLIYPEFISINHAGYDTIAISVRGPKTVDPITGHDVSGQFVEIEMSKADLLTLLEDAHDKLHGATE